MFGEHLLSSHQSQWISLAVMEELLLKAPGKVRAEPVPALESWPHCLPGFSRQSRDAAATCGSVGPTLPPLTPKTDSSFCESSGDSPGVRNAHLVSSRKEERPGELQAILQCGGSLSPAFFLTSFPLPPPSPLSPGHLVLPLCHGDTTALLCALPSAYSSIPSLSPPPNQEEEQILLCFLLPTIFLTGRSSTLPISAHFLGTHHGPESQSHPHPGDLLGTAAVNRGEVPVPEYQVPTQTWV